MELVKKGLFLFFCFSCMLGMLFVVVVKYFDEKEKAEQLKHPLNSEIVARIPQQFMLQKWNGKTYEILKKTSNRDEIYKVENKLQNVKSKAKEMTIPPDYKIEIKWVNDIQKYVRPTGSTDVHFVGEDKKTKIDKYLVWVDKDSLKVIKDGKTNQNVFLSNEESESLYKILTE
ncbi:hypothetical protein E2K98_12985 [Bacillus salipaludis]|uniref:Uncharacterized protein n=1 Tax=Bacillus salipaludis TaxID=2547811 RepID=A0A4R5VSP9_9BACI|nr:hypothetical protein [Bacillus salipaludis]TDK61796.1 hypothetical protein E2K98_12985 [Bacillus salipaludis]